MTNQKSNCRFLRNGKRENISMAMKVERFEVEGLAQYSYVVSDEGEAVVIDAIRDVDRYVRYARAEGLRIVAVVETHIHADFAAGSKELAERSGAELALSGYDRGERFEYAMAHGALKDGDALKVGRGHLVVMHTPGHTPEHLSFVLYEGSEPVAMFSGDFLFVGSLGRPDLLGEDAKVALAHAMYASVQRMEGLPDGLKVYPGHGAGSFCGAGMGESAETTLGFERATNRFFGMDEAEFVREILGSTPAMPGYYPRMKALNAVGAVALAEVATPRAMSAVEVNGLRGVMLLDVRGVEAFAEGHVAGAVNIGVGGNLSLWAGWLLEAEREIVLVADAGDVEEVRAALMRVGLDGVIGYLKGGMESWIAAELPVARTRLLSVADVRRDGGSAVLLDVRNDQEWESGSVPGARHVMLGDLPQAMAEMAKESKVITMCGSGYRSSVAASLLERAGFADVSSMDGGTAAWVQAGLELVREL
jgi:hydroxyacylglutathione hydrolase